MKFKFRHADKIVGVFTLLALLFICFMLIMVGKNNRWFEEDVYFRTQFSTANSLSKGMKIKLRGFEIGEIKTIELNNENMVDVEFIIYNNYIDKIRPGSVLELNTSPLGGGLNFYPGLGLGAIPEPYSYIPTTQFPEGKNLVQKGLVDKPEESDIVTDLLNQVPNLLSDVDKTVVTVNELLYTVNASLQGNPDAGPIPGILYGLDDTIEEVNVIVSNLGAMTNSLAVLLSQMEDPEDLIPRLVGDQGVAGAVFSDNSELFMSIYDVIDQLTISMSNIAALTGSLSELSPQISLLLKETTATLGEAEDVLEGLKNNPLLRGGVSQDEEPSEPVGSDVRDDEF
ncbi:MAG: MlaD family protein [Spirochaetaceae bacterium]|jgi:phospholipid/cholesterol/gamma-HCH transport system substrate-binding protein|nr:MlaD family protein [Spirochaetaceae bacterium]